MPTALINSFSRWGGWNLIFSDPDKASKIIHQINDGLVSPIFTFFVLTIYLFRRFYKQKVVLTRKHSLSVNSLADLKIRDEVTFQRGKFGRFLMFMFGVWYAVNYMDKFGLADLIVGTDPRLQEVLNLSPLIRKGPAPPIWFSSRHVQFIPWIVQNEIHKLFGGIPYERHYFDVIDKIYKGDVTSENHASMIDTVTLDVFPPFDDKENEYNNFPADAPVILFAPGLRCHSQDIPGNSIIRVAYSKGYRSIVINRRGHTPDTLLASPRFNLFGDVDDLEQIYWHVKDNMLPVHTPMFLEGVSSGCAVVVAALGEWDRRRLASPEIRTPSFVSAVVVTPGYDTSKCLREDRFSYPYNYILLQAVQDHFIRRNEKVLREFNSTAVDRALSAPTLQDFLDEAAVFAGYKTAEEYYLFTNPINVIQHITTPIYVLNSYDDPCCDIGNLYEESEQVYHGGMSYNKLVAKSESGLIAVTRSGSHCPFIDGALLPFTWDPFWVNSIMINSWADTSVMEWFLATKEVYKDRALL